jgi:GTP-binding protein
MKFNKGKFLFSILADNTSLPDVKNKNGVLLKEIAVVGKSNVGKSSLINHLLNCKHLAKVSATPGKTQTLNFFNVDDCVCLVDLPGYGFSKVSKTLQVTWKRCIQEYLHKRDQLALILLLMDLRHEPTEQDVLFITWALFYKKPLLIVFTKADKIAKTKRLSHSKKILGKILEKTGFNPTSYVLYSIEETFCKKQLIKQINEAYS